MNRSAPLAACVSPPGTAAIAVVGLLGPNAWNLVEPLFQARGARPSPGEHKHFWLGRFGDEITDEVVVSVGGSGSRQRVEIQCHGGPAVVRWLLDLLEKRGAAIIPWEEWLHRGHPSRLQAEAAIALSQALTQRTASILLDQYHGALSAALEDLAQEIANGGAGTSAKRQALLDRIPLGRHLTRPWRVVLAGAPNVGKSTLLNAVLGFQRAITSPVPGTTRDVVTALTAFDGWPVELADTAGAHEQAVGLEAAGIGLARQASTAADLCLWILDATARPVLPPDPLPVPILPVVNKIDQPFAWPLGDLGDLGDLPWPATEVVRVSARTGEGLPVLLEAVASRLVPHPPAPGAAVPFANHVCESLIRVDEALRSGHSDRAVELLRACDTPLFPVE